MSKQFQLKANMFDWVKGELFSLDAEWNEWTRKSTGERFNTRGSISKGEKALLLNYLVDSTSWSILSEVKL